MLPTPRSRAPRIVRRAFTLVEAMLAIAMLAVAGSALLLASSSALETNQSAMEEMLANGIAQQLMEEILTRKYCDPADDGHSTYLGPGASETSRLLYNDIDDYNGYRARPPKDIYDVPLGNDGGGSGTARYTGLRAQPAMIKTWQEEVDVYYVAPPNWTTKRSNSNPSDYRMIEVRIVDRPVSGPARTLATIKRIVSYVPPMS